MKDTAQADSAALQDLLAQVEGLRCPAPGLLRPDPVRLRYIEALARRLPAASPAVQQVLQAKLEAALRTLGHSGEAAAFTGPSADVAPLAAIESAPPTPTPGKPKAKTGTPAVPLPATPLSLLGQLNQHIHTAAQADAAAVAADARKGLATTARPDLKSAVRFRETWARISAETEVDKAADRAPENAGPLNAHRLVLRTLTLMRELSPDYLRRFMSHTESLLWLDQAYGQLKQPAGKAKAAKSAKAGKRA